MKNIKKYVLGDHNTIKEAVTVIKSNLSRCIIVVNEKKKVVGTFSEGDVLRVIMQDMEFYSPLKHVINPSFRYLNKRDMSKAYQIVKKFGITLIPVVDSNFLLKDVITIYDVLDHLSFKSRKA